MKNDTDMEDTVGKTLPGTLVGFTHCISNGKKMFFGSLDRSYAIDFIISATEFSLTRFLFSILFASQTTQKNKARQTRRGASGKSLSNVG